MKKIIILSIFTFLLNACQVFDSESDTAANAAIVSDPWNFIQDKFSANILENDRISAERDQILLNAKAFERSINFSEPYIYYIASQMHKNNMPLELALVPLIESFYNPQAKSPVKAAGLWQFMPITAKEYNMQRDKQFDARLDVIESTQAAILLLRDLNNRFGGDWLLTLAAYNAGEGRVKNAISYNKSKNFPTNFWALDLPQETMRYVPRLLAMIDVIRNKDKYNVNLPNFNYENSLVRIDLEKNVTLSTISEYSNISKKELIRYNAGYIKQTVNGPFHLLVPYVYAEELHQKLQADNLVKNEIIELLHSGSYNQDKFDFELTNNKYSEISNENIRYYTKVNNINRHINYIVKSGDNISNIAKKYKVKNSDILKWNKLKNSNIRVGQKLALIINASQVMHNTAKANANSPTSQKTNSVKTSASNKVGATNSRVIKYVIKSGDNLYSIARNYRVNVSDILRWNNLKNEDIRAGEKLTINLASTGQL